MSRPKRSSKPGRRARASRKARRPSDPRWAARALEEVRKAQAETSEELAQMRLQTATEPAFVFRP